MAEIFMPAHFPAVGWRAQEVVKDLNGGPHLLVRVEITGGQFPQRAPHPFVRILVGRKLAATDWFAGVSDDNRSLIGYFNVDLPRQGTIEYGYGATVWGRVEAKFASAAIKRLDRKLLSKATVVVSKEFLKTRLERRPPTP